MPNTVLRQDQIREETLSRLGGSRLEVELDQRDLDQATREAIRVYSRYVPLQGWKSIPATVTQKRYVLDLAQHPGFTGIIDVQFLTRRTDPSSIDPFDPYDSVVGGLLVGDETFADVMQRLVYTEDAARVVSAEPEWRGEWEGADFALYLDIVRTPTLVAYNWCGAYSTDVTAANGMHLIPFDDTDWILNYIEARAMVTLGRVRRKFGGIPNSDGGVDEIDGNQFVDEGNQKTTDLMEEIRSRRIPLPPTIE